MEDPTALNYRLCATPYDVQLALADVGQYPYVIADCEGLKLGKVNGALSLLCLGTPEPVPAQRIYVVDIPAIKYLPAAHAAIVAFLSRCDIAKVFWDGRMDYIELRDVFGVEPACVLDLQVVEALARREDDVRHDARLRRLFPDLELDPTLFAGIQVVLGMQAAMEIYVPQVPLHKDPAVEEIHKTRQTHLWLSRPILPLLLRYAAVDIRLFAHLFSAFTFNSFIPPDAHSRELLCAASARYISRGGQHHGARQSFVRDGPHQLHNLLMRDALLLDPGARLHACTQCNWNLPVSCFPCTTAARREQCRVCIAGDLKTFAHKRKLEETWVRLEE